MNTQLLCFDYGLSNIGVASGNLKVGIASPLTELKAKDGIPNWTVIEQLIKEWKPSKVLVGLPLNMDGSESELSSRARKFGNRLNGRFNIDVEMIDERLTSHAAKEQAKQRGHRGNYKDNPIDSEAACLILEQYFNNQ